jgi:hypothetical protein
MMASLPEGYACAAGVVEGQFLRPGRARWPSAGQGDGGIAIHVLGDIAGQEVELLAFDCFRI